MPVGQSNQKKPRAMVTRSHEDAFTCVNVERPGSSENSKKRNLNRLTGNHEAIYSAACRVQSNDGQIYIGVGKLNGRPVKVLRYTGCIGMIVDRALLPDSMVIPGSSGSLQMVDTDRRAKGNGQCLSGVPVLQRTLQSDVCQLPHIRCDNWLRERCTPDVARSRLEG